MLNCAGGSIFSTSTQQYIKILGGDFVAISGPDTLEKLVTSDLRIPYKQILKGRVTLGVGQTNYLMNHLGLGDNATFLAMKATYNAKSVNAEDNYVVYTYYTDLTKNYFFDDLLVLTGSPTQRIPQLYLTNPNTKYAVQIDVMVAVLDDTYTWFTDVLNQTGTSFVNLEYTDIRTHVVGESIVVFDQSSPKRPLIYIMLHNINSINRSGQILIIEDTARGTIFLQFKTVYDACQAHSLLNYILENPSISINDLDPVEDLVPPTVYFYSRVGNFATGSYIAFNGSTATPPYNTSNGFTFSTELSLSQWGASGSGISKNYLRTLLIENTLDNRDGLMTLTASNLVLQLGGVTVSSVATAGSYSLTFDVSDLAQNKIDGVVLNLTVTT
jgi:hypothetical protein